MKRFVLFCLLTCLLAVPVTAQEPVDANAVLVEYHDASPFSYPDITEMYFFLGELQISPYGAKITFDQFALRHCTSAPFGLPPGYDGDVCRMWRPRPYGPEVYELVARGAGSWWAVTLSGAEISLDRFDDREGPYFILRIDEPDGSFWIYDLRYGTPDEWFGRRHGGKRYRR